MLVAGIVAGFGLGIVVGLLLFAWYLDKAWRS